MANQVGGGAHCVCGNERRLLDLWRYKVDCERLETANAENCRSSSPPPTTSFLSTLPPLSTNIRENRDRPKEDQGVHFLFDRCLQTTENFLLAMLVARYSLYTMLTQWAKFGGLLVDIFILQSICMYSKNCSVRLTTL